jgi:excisionase family DNA binding protein
VNPSWSEGGIILHPHIVFSPYIGFALRHLEPEEALSLFEQDDEGLETLRKRQVYTDYLGSGDAPLYTVKGCAAEIDRLLKHHDDEGEREHLVGTGLPGKTFRTSALLGPQMVELYPTRLPAGVEVEGGERLYAWSLDPWSEDAQPCSYEESPLRPGLDEGEAERLESLRGKVLNLRIAALTAIARGLRGTDPKAMWRGVRDAIQEALSVDDVYFLLGVDGSPSGFGLAHPESPLSADGALSALLGLAGYCEKELKLGTMAKTREALGGLVREEKRGRPRIPFNSYYEVLGTPKEERVEAGCDRLWKLEERERGFWSKYEQRVNRTLAEASAMRVSIANMVRPEYASHYSPVMETHKEGLLTAEQVAQRLGVHPKTIYLKARTGDIPSRRIGDAVRFVWSEVDEALRAQAERNVERRSKDRGQG